MWLLAGLAAKGGRGWLQLEPCCSQRGGGECKLGRLATKMRGGLVQSGLTVDEN